MREENHKSRLKTHLKKQAYKNILLATLGIVLVGILLIIFGTNILVSFSLLVGKLTGTEESTTTTQSLEYIAPPTLDIPQEATSSASVTITGYGESKHRIDLFSNGKLIGKTTVKSNNTFKFGNVTIEKGENVIKARAVNEENKHSEYSNEVRISLLNEPPELTVSEPTDGLIYKKDGRPVKVAGKTNPGVKVTVNDFWAIVDDEGNFSYQYSLKDGENDLKIVATDKADNKTTKDLKIRAE